MSITSLNISLPQPLKTYVETQVRHGGYSTPSEYVRALIREDQNHQERARIESMLLEGIGSGEPVETGRAHWSKKRRLLAERLKQASRP